MWTKIAEMDTEAEIPEYEEAEYLADIDSDHLRTVCSPIEGSEERFLVEEKRPDANEGWARVAIINPDYGDIGEVANEYADQVEELGDYRIVFDHNIEEYIIERYYE